MFSIDISFEDPTLRLASKLFHKNVIDQKIASQNTNSTSQVAGTARLQNVASIAKQSATLTHNASEIPFVTVQTTISSDGCQDLHISQTDSSTLLEPLPQTEND